MLSLLRFVFFTFIFLRLAAAEVGEQEQSTQSLDTLQMRACLLKNEEKESSYFAYQIKFINIGNRKIFLTVEQDPLQRFDVSPYSNGEQFLRRDFTDSDMPEEIYGQFSLVPMKPGQSVTFITRFSDFYRYLRKTKISKSSSFL